MKRTHIKKRLALKTETVRTLADHELGQVDGGAVTNFACSLDPTQSPTRCGCTKPVLQ